MKVCFKCGQLKPLSEFYKHPAMADGHLNKCKECAKKDIRENREANLEYYRQYDRERSLDPRRIKANLDRQKTEKGAEIHRRALKKYAEQHPDRAKATRAVRAAVVSGKLSKQPCVICGSEERIQAHHFDYELPLSVIWVCEHCHKAIHRGLNELKRNYG